MRGDVPRIVVAAAASGAGKTTLTAGLVAALRAGGLRVQPYKVGPDYIDPGFLTLAAGRPAENLDTWLVPRERLSTLFAETAADADIAVIEGVMGLYDGGPGGVSSTAEIAEMLGAPVVLVIDAKAMGTSAAAFQRCLPGRSRRTSPCGPPSAQRPRPVCRSTRNAAAICT